VVADVEEDTSEEELMGPNGAPRAAGPAGATGPSSSSSSIKK
jgi:hypothetical protein